MENKEQGKAPKVTFEDDRKVGTHVYEQPYVESVGSDESEEFAADSKTEQNVDPQFYDPPLRPPSPSSVNRLPAEEWDNESGRQREAKRDQEINRFRYVSPSGSFQRRGSISRSQTAYGVSTSSRDPRDSGHNRSPQEEFSKAEISFTKLYPKQISRAPLLIPRQNYNSTRKWSGDGFGYENPTRLSTIREDAINGPYYNESGNQEYNRAIEEPLFFYEQTPDKRRHIRNNEEDLRNRSERFEDLRDRYGPRTIREQRESSRYNHGLDGNGRSHDRPHDREESQHYSQMDSRERQAYGDYGDRIRPLPRAFVQDGPGQDRMSSPSLSHELSPRMEQNLMRILHSESMTEKIENLIKRMIEDDIEERMNSTRYEEQLKQDLLWNFKQAAIAEIEKHRLESEELKKRTLEEKPSYARVKAENKGKGKQFLTDGSGDQNVASNNAAIFHGNQQFTTQNFFSGSMEQINKEALFSTGGAFQQVSRSRSWPPEGPGHNDIIDWLAAQPSQPYMIFSQHRKYLTSQVTQVTQGTGNWILNKQEFLKWKDSSNSSRILCLNGIHGSGKTMIVSLIIQSIQTEIQIKEGTACIYFLFQEDDKQHVSPADIWATLLIQLLKIEAVGVSNELKARISHPFQKPALIDSSEYLDLLRAQAVAFTSVYLIIDGLDRCLYNTSQVGALKEISESLRDLPSHVRILFTSRDSYIGEEIGTNQKIPITPMEEDVRAYVKKRISDDSMLNIVLKQSEHRDYVIQRVTDKTLSAKMFLSAKLHVDNLIKQTNFHDIKTALETLADNSPASKLATKKVAQRINETDDGECHLSKHILMWVTHAKEEINIKQIQDSFAIQKSEGQCYEHHRPVKKAVMRACTELVIRDPEKETLTLSHKSVKEHLEQAGTIPNNSDFQIARTCLYFLINTCNAKKTSPLLQYAAKHWQAHLSGKEQTTDESMALLIIQFLKNGSNLITALQALEQIDSSLLNGMTGWHAAVYFNLISWADHLITFGVDAQCSNGQTALHWAVRYDRGMFLDLLICKSANPNLFDEAGDTPLHLALATGNITMAQALIRGKAQIDIRNKKNISPLELAIQYGPTSIAQMMIESQKNVNEEIFQDWTLLRQVLSHNFIICSEKNEDGLSENPKEWSQYEPQVADARNHIHFLTNMLLERGVDLNRPSTKTGWTPLVFAASKGDLYLMRRLLTCDKPAKVDLRDREKKSPLWWAIHSEIANGIQLLSDHGADVNETYGDGSTPLYEAVKKKNSKLVQLLVTLGANVNASVNSRTGKRSTLLIEAIRLQDSDTASVLLNAEAKPDEQDANDKSPLFYAIKSGDGALVWLLISKNSAVESLSPEMNARNSTSIQSPLEVALRQKDYSTAYLLCENGASPNTVIGNKKRTLLQWAIQQNDLRAVRLLVHYGASVDSQDENGLTSLHWAVLFRRQNIMTLLISYITGPSLLNIADKHGNTPLSLAVQKDIIAFIRVLILYGASCNATDLDGLTAVHHAARKDFREGLRMMLNSNGDPNVADKEGFTAVHHAVDGAGTSPGLISMLVAAGADLEAKDNNGRTPLMIATQRDKHEMIGYLFEKGVNIEEQDKDGYIALHYAQLSPS